MKKEEKKHAIPNWLESDDDIYWGIEKDGFHL